MINRCLGSEELLIRTSSHARTNPWRKLWKRKDVLKGENKETEKENFEGWQWQQEIANNSILHSSRSTIMWRSLLPQQQCGQWDADCSFTSFCCEQRFKSQGASGLLWDLWECKSQSIFVESGYEFSWGSVALNTNIKGSIQSMIKWGGSIGTVCWQTMTKSYVVNQFHLSRKTQSQKVPNVVDFFSADKCKM